MGRCVAFGCKEIGIYKFPSNVQSKRKWEKALRLVNYKSSEFSRLCRKHFKETDFETTSKTTGFPLQRKFLKKSAVPSIFCWNQSQTGTSARTKRLQQRNARRCLLPVALISDSSEPLPPTSSGLIPNINEEESIQEVEITMKDEEITTAEHNSLENRLSQATQTSTCFRIFSIDELLIDSESVLYYTGLETYEKFKLVLSTLCPMAFHLQFKGSQIINIGIKEQFLIMLIKLRRNETDFELSKYFGSSKTVISNIFVTWLNFTYDLWSLIDIWPERDLIDYYMPSQFKKYDSNTRIVIIDGIEIPIAKQNHPISQQATFSTYKNKNTMKFFVGATPGGLFSYCSEAYGGSTSDRQMIERSDLLEKCDSGDIIMADRGFNVQDIFANKNIGVNIPSFLKGKSQLTGVRVIHDQQLASQRVLNEQLIGLSKTFTILKSDLNAYYIPLASRIFFVCVMLCNFREGIVKPTK